MTTTERITAVRRQLVHQQGGICARCGQPLGDAVHIARIRPISDGGGPALVSAGNLVVVHPTCTIEPDLRHTFYVPCCGCANCARLKAQGDRDAERTPRDVHCGRCGAKPGEPCESTGFVNWDSEHHAARLEIQYLGDCPTCGSAGGWPCLSDSGRVTRPHKARVEGSRE